MHINGLIIQKRIQNQRHYQGVEGDNWYLNFDLKELGIFYEENIEKAWGDSDYVDVCNHLEFIQKYIFLSKSKNIDYRVLVCMTERKYPQMELPVELNMSFLGYDYAYSGGSYYSAVLNDIISKRIPQFANIQVNRYGLFETYEQVADFIKLRESMKKSECSQEEYLEEGDFIIYKLFELDI